MQYAILNKVEILLNKNIGYAFFNAIARKVLYRTIGQMETVKSTQPCHVTDYYDHTKKQLSEARSCEKAAIASMHKLIRTIYALIIND